MKISKSIERIELIDVLRGFTLLGIILVHMVEQYYAGAPPQKAMNYNNHFWGDEIVQALIFIFVTGKFYMIFSFLFGLSFFIQFSKSDGSAKFYVRFLWRLIILFAIGWLHNIHYRGDILTIYAMLGVGLLIFHNLPDKLMLILAIAMTINVPSFFIRGIEALTTTPAEATETNPFGGDDEVNERYFDTLKSGNYMAILQANIPEFKSKIEFQVSSGRVFITLGLFLLGHYAGRKKFFENIVQHLAALKKYRNRSLWTILGVILFSAAFFGGAELLSLKLSNEVSWMVGGLVYDIMNAALALIYVCVLILLYQKEKWQSRLQHFYEVGRMGLTTYLMQTVIGVLIFFGFGLNLLNVLGAALSASIALLIFYVQILFSKWWLSQFNYGPVEWLWRSLTYWKVQPFKKA